MPKTLLFFTAAFFLFSCGIRSVGEFRYRTAEKENKIFIERKAYPGKTAFEVTFISADVPLKTAAEFCVGSLERFMELSAPYDPSLGTVRIGPESDLYRVYFQLGAFSLPEFKNGLLKTGYLQSRWRKWVIESRDKNDDVSIYLKKEKHNMFRVPELDDLLSRYCDKDADIGQVYPYAVSYLLKQILFVSLQEILSRPYRYDRPGEVSSAFSQIVTVPESLVFTDYLTEKFGSGRTLTAAKTEFSTNSWKKAFGEEFHDTEADFTSKLESRTFGGAFVNAEFRAKLDELLELYNRSTKNTLFRK